MTNQKQINPESLEAKQQRERENESIEKRLEFKDKYEEKLKNALWSENSIFIWKIQDLFERNKWDIVNAIRQAFSSIDWNWEYIKDVNSLIQELVWEKNEKKENGNKSDYWKNSVYLPILTRLEEWWYINSEEKEKALNTKNKSELKENVIKLINSIKWNNSEELKKSLLEFISPDTNSDESEKKFYTEDNFEESQFYKDFKWDWETSPDKKDNFDILIANNYISIPEKDKEKDKNKDLGTSLDIVKWKIIEKESPDFIERNATLISKIDKAENIWEKYSLTKNLYAESLRDDWIKKSTQIKEKEHIDTNKILEEIKTNTHFESLRKLIKDSYEKNINYESTKDSLWKLATSLEKLDEYLIKNPWDQKAKKIKVDIEKIFKNPENYNRQSIENLTAEINSLTTQKA